MKSSSFTAKPFLSFQKTQKCGDGFNQSGAADIPFCQKAAHFLCITQVGAVPGEHLVVAGNPDEADLNLVKTEKKNAFAVSFLSYK